MKRLYLLRRILDLASPRRCSVCSERLSISEQFVGGDCLVSLPLTFYHLCPYENRMARLFWGRLPIERATALFHFLPHSASANIIYDIKYHHAQQMGEYFGCQIAHHVSVEHFFDDIDMLIPIPLSRQRKQQRGYNQSEQIARGIAKVTGIAVRTDIVHRIKDNPSQTHLAKHERQKNVEGIFSLLKPEAIRGRHIMLVDDIVTTGATLMECGTTLMGAGDVRFSIITLGTTKY